MSQKGLHLHITGPDYKDRIVKIEDELGRGEVTFLRKSESRHFKLVGADGTELGHGWFTFLDGQIKANTEPPCNC